ncbi:MAG: hypothetical protein ACXW3S_14080 [Rhodoplanes sp.]
MRPASSVSCVAEQGHSDRQLVLGLAYAMGEGVPKDALQAYMWLNLAAAQGTENAARSRGLEPRNDERTNDVRGLLAEEALRERDDEDAATVDEAAPLRPASAKACGSARLART